MGNEQATIEAGEATGSTPATGDEHAGAATNDTAAAPQRDGKGSASQPAAKVDADALAFERLANGESAKSIRQSPDKPADPSTDDSSQRQQGKAGTTTSKTKGREAPAGNSEPKGVADAGQDSSPTYDGIDAKAVDTLRRAQLLVPAEDWQNMNLRARLSLLASARDILRVRGKLSQQIGQQRAKGQQQQADDNAQLETDEDLADTGEEAEQQVEDEEQAGTPAPQPPRNPRGVLAQAQPKTPAPATTAPVESDADLDALFEPVTEYMGDAIATPLKTAFTQQRQHTQQLRQSLAQQQQINHAYATQIEGMAKQIFLPQEREAFKEIEHDSGSTLTAAQRKDVATNAVHFFKASADGGEPITWKEAILRSSRSVLNQDIQQQAQAKLLDRRSQSLRASPARGNAGTVRPDRGLSKEDRDARAWQMLTEQGLEGKDVRAALNA